MGEYNFEVTSEFSYLGTKLTQDNDEGAEIQRRITSATRAYYSLLPMLKSKNIHIKTKLRLYKTMIRTVAAYGGETWTHTGDGGKAG